MASFLVRATQRGYYKWLRAAGEEFMVEEAFYAPANSPSFIGGWMEKVTVADDPVAAPAVDTAATPVPPIDTGASTLHEPKGVQPPEAS